MSTFTVGKFDLQLLALWQDLETSQHLCSMCCCVILYVFVCYLCGGKWEFCAVQSCIEWCCVRNSVLLCVTSGTPVLQNPDLNCSVCQEKCIWCYCRFLCVAVCDKWDSCAAESCIEWCCVSETVVCCCVW